MSDSDFKEITIHHRTLFNQYMNQHPIEVGDMSFLSIFAWSNVFEFKYIEKNGYLLIISENQDKMPFAFSPIGKYDQNTFDLTLCFLKEYFDKNQWHMRFSLVPEMDLQRFRAFEQYNFEYVDHRENSDYIYCFQDFVNLQGSQYEDKRRQINWFKKHCNYEYVTLNDQVFDECFEIFDEWCNSRECHTCHPGCEKKAILKILEQYPALGCKGGLVRVEGKAKAFIITEALNGNTVVSHIEKADRNIKGLYAYLNQVHYLREYQGFDFINLEEDMGLEGLRKSKLSYHPVRLIKKYEITDKKAP